MISEEAIRVLVEERFSGWQVYTKQSGVALWVNISDGSPNFFTVQVTPHDGVGVSVVDNSGLDMSGHDKAFETLEPALDYIDSIVSGKYVSRDGSSIS